MAKYKFQLPAAEDHLWHQVVVRLLNQRHIEEHDARNELRVLEELAFHHRFCGKPLTYTFVEDTTTWLAEERKFVSPLERARAWLRDLEQWELVRRRGTGNDATYEFAIPTLDEYFAACRIARKLEDGDTSFNQWVIPTKGASQPEMHCSVCSYCLPKRWIFLLKIRC